MATYRSTQLNESQRPEYTTNHKRMNINSNKLNYNINDLTDGRLTWPYRATQMNAIHNSFIFTIAYIFKYELQILKIHLQPS